MKTIMKTTTKIKMSFCLVLLLTWSLPVWAKTPMASLQGLIDEVISLLNSPQYQDAAKKKEQGDKIWVVIEEVFDFQKISRLTLGKNWKKFSDKELDEFSVLFSNLLGKTYLKKVQDEFKNEKVNYMDEKILTGKKNERAQVKTALVRKNMEIPVEYSMWKNNGVWRIYDVKVEGISLVKNYRTQFQKILFNKSPGELIAQVKKKVDGMK